MTGDYQVSIEEATAFLDVAKFCVADTREFLSGKMYPFAVNASFACELFIKAIMIKKSPINAFVRGHDLKELYNALDSDDKAEVEALYNKKTAQPSLNEFLDKSGGAFENWRYAFEKSVSISMNGIIAFAESLQEYNKIIMAESKKNAV